uniref:Cytochrome b-c1 complex subunit 8 n=1 Tax=Hydra vulgaris TaxID=6087 RepID=T2MJ33_HYDVU
MGFKFGELVKFKNVIEYSISPFEQRAFAGFLSKGFPNLYRRFMSQVFYVAPPFLGLAFIINWANKKNAQLSRKNPKDYENDV